MNTQKGFAPILLILLGLIVIGGGVYFYKTKSTLKNGESVRENEVQNASSTNNLAKNNKQEQTKTNNNEADIFSARSILENVQQKYSINSKIQNNVTGYYADTTGYRLVVKSEDISKIEDYFRSDVLLKVVDASELGYTFKSVNGEGKVMFGCETSTGRPEIETDETESGFYPGTEASVYCWDINF